MPDEIELKFLDIDKDTIIKKIEALGAKKVYDEQLWGYSFDGHGCARRDSTKKYLRVRSEGDKTFLTYKGPREDSDLTIREELEVGISDLETAKQLLEKLGFESSRKIEKRRIHYELDKTHFEIELYGFFPPFLEIEAPSREAMEKACEQLNLNIKDGKVGMMSEIRPDVFKD